MFDFSPLCIFKNISLICSQKKMHCHIRWICSTFLCCVLWNVCSKRLHKRMQIHIGCICLNLTHCAFANVLSKHIHKNIFNYTRCICFTFLDCALPFVLLNVWEYEDELEKSQHNIVIWSVESYSCRSHTSYLSRIPRKYPCKFFLARVNFYTFNAKNWHFWQILREKVAFFFLQI